MQLLILVLFASFGLVTGLDKIFYYAGKVDKNGILTLDAKNATGPQDLLERSKKVIDFAVLHPKQTEENHEYWHKGLEASDVAQSEFGLPLSADDKGCSIIEKAHKSGLYALLGLSLKAHTKSKYAPSITYMIKKGPSKITYKNIPAGLEEQFQDKDIQQTCESVDALNYTSFGLKAGGLTSQTCFPNSGIPEQTSKCVDNKKVKTKLKGYKIGYFKDYSQYDVKKLITRLGAVLVDNQVIFGWTRSGKWIIAVEDPNEYKYAGIEKDIVGKYYHGQVLFNESTLDVAVVIAIVFGSIIGFIGLIALIYLIYHCCKKMV
ncbi:MAG: hypothetical protein EZS28_020058 [Streblomastix strix]|uniref:Uncharacterized protein n=1 Tax=Streblomastix strix TaxID=222440 RepID=A0A5J4VPK3_9EUKA|nr:MAG: hypothetical protein EZS28_020058 [Streblomastix strix]